MFHFDRDFVDKNGERYMFPVRIRSLMKILQQKYVTRYEASTGDFLFADGDMTFAQTALANFTPFEAGRTLWGRPDQFVWFRQTVTIPEEFCGEDIWYVVYPYTQKDVWPWGQPQIQMFVNGECVCGLDNNHRRHLLLRNAKGGEVLQIDLKAYSDLTYYQGLLTMEAHLQVCRPRVYELFRSIQVPLEAAALMRSDSTERVAIVKALNETMNILRMDADPDSPEFIASVEAAEAYLDENLYGTLQNGAEPVLWSVGHTHIDVAWQWTYHVTRNKTARSFASTLRLMEQNPEYLFMSSQPQLYEFVKQDEPALYEQIRRRIAEGRWEPEGGMWVEADTNLTSGESLVRQFLYGKRFFKAEFGKDNEILWLPDVFGYSANLPQICRRSGIKYFYTTKIGWNEYNKLPYDTFRWRGLDGSTVLTHFGCAISYAEQETDWMTTYNPTLEPHFAMGAWNRYQQKDINRDLLYDYGFGDGGGGPTQEMIDHGRRYQKGVPGCPVVKFAHTKDYFRHLDATVSDNRHLPEWDGEMYLEFHRGTYTSQAQTKKNNRRSEQTYHDAENLWSFAMALDCDEKQYPQQMLHDNWKLILLNQFHDVLPGSSIHEVYEDAQRHYTKVLTEGAGMCADAANHIAGRVQTQGESVVVFNTMSFPRSAVVIFDGELPGLTDQFGSVIPCQKTYDGKTVFVACDIPAKGYKTFTVAPADCDCAVTVSAEAMESEMMRVCFDEKMHITSLFSKTADRETLPEGRIGGRILAFEDVALKDDAWNVQAYYREKCFVVDDVTSVQVLEAGPVRGVLRVERKFRNSTIRTDVVMYSHLDELQFDYDIDWHEQNLFVKAEYPVDVNAKYASYEIQFGYLQRPVGTSTLWDFARFEHCGHKWADLSDGGFGLAILNDCKYGFDADRNALRISLLKCSTYPDPKQDQGHHSFSYAVYPHGLDALQARVRDRAYEFNFKPHVVHIPAAQAGVLPTQMSLLWVDAPNVVIETVKKAEDSDALVVRMYEAENKGTRCTLQTAFAVSGCTECNLMEEAEQELPVRDGKIELLLRPFEIKTLLLRK